MSDKQRIRMFLIRTMRFENNRCAAIAEIDADNNILFAYGLFVEDVSRSEMYRAYSEWLLNYVEDGELIEAKVSDITANDKERSMPYSRIRYFNGRRLIHHGKLNWIATVTLKNKSSKEFDTN